MAVQRCQSNKAKRMKFSAPLGSPVGLHLLSVPMPKAGTRDDARLRIRTALKARLRELLGDCGDDALLRSMPGQAVCLAAPFAHIGLSISHEPGLSVAAINLAGPVGIDLMCLHAALPDMATLAIDYLGPAVCDAIQQHPTNGRTEVFARAWTAHEACLKCLHLPLVEWTPELAKKLATCRWMAIETAPGVVASVAIGRSEAFGAGAL